MNFSEATCYLKKGRETKDTQSAERKSKHSSDNYFDHYRVEYTRTEHDAK
jgi:hypothetical protein